MNQYLESAQSDQEEGEEMTQPQPHQPNIPEPSDDDVLAKAKAVLISGDSTGCDGLIVITLESYWALQAAVHKATGRWYGQLRDD